MNFTSEELKKLREALPTGSIDAISSKLGISVHSVRGTLHSPKRFKPEVIATALDIIAEQKKTIELLKSKIEQL